MFPFSFIINYWFSVPIARMSFTTTILQVRVSTKPEGQGSRGLAWYHIDCFVDMSPLASIERIQGWDSLSSKHKEAVSALFKTKSSSAKEGSIGHSLT